MRKKLLSLLLCIAMVASMVTIPAMGAGPDVTAIRFSDLAGHWAEKSIIRWTDYGVVRGDPAGTFRPNADLSRREMATILSNFLHLTVKAENVDTRDYLTVKGYPWHVEAVLKCAAAGIMNGDEGLAKAGSSVTRQEAMVMLGIALGITPAPKADLAAFTDGATVADWAAGYVTALTKAGIVAGVGKNRIAPLANISRASVLSILDRAVSDYIAAPGTYDKVLGTGIVAVVVPDVVLKGNKIAGSLLVAQGVGDGDFTLDGTHVAGRTTVRGGGMNSFVIKGGSKLGDLTIARVDGAVRIVTSDGSTIEATYVDDGKDNVILEGKLGNLSIADDVPVTLKGADVKTVTATGKNADITVDKTSKVETLATQGENTKITVAGTVTNVAATAEAKGVALNVSKGGTATNVATAAAGSVIKNNGNLGSLAVAKGAETVFAKGENTTKTNITAADKKDLSVTTIAAQDAKEAVAKAAADKLAAEQAAAKAAADKAAAEKLAADAKSEAEKAAAAKAQAEAAAKEAAAKAAADKAAADKAAADKAQADAKKEADKVKETTKVDEKPVTPPEVGKDGEIVVPKPIAPEKPKPEPEPDYGPTYYTVTFVPNGANINNMNPPAQSVVSGGRAKAPGGIGKGGSTFHGWFTTVDFQGTRWDFATNTVTGPTTLYAKWLAYTKDDVDEIIRGGIFDVNGKMVMSEQDKTKYAQLSELAGSTVTVNITNGTVDVAKVYTDIITTLVAALKVNEAHIATLKIGGADPINVTASISGENIKSIVKASGLTGANGNIAGSDTISVLYTQSTTATVKDVNNVEYAYTLTFVDKTTP